MGTSGAITRAVVALSDALLEIAALQEDGHLHLSPLHAIAWSSDGGEACAVAHGSIDTRKTRFGRKVSQRAVALKPSVDRADDLGGIAGATTGRVSLRRWHVPDGEIGVRRQEEVALTHTLLEARRTSSRTQEHLAVLDAHILHTSVRRAALILATPGARHIGMAVRKFAIAEVLVFASGTRNARWPAQGLIVLLDIARVTGERESAVAKPGASRRVHTGAADTRFELHLQDGQVLIERVDTCHDSHLRAQASSEQDVETTIDAGPCVQMRCAPPEDPT